MSPVATRSSGSKGKAARRPRPAAKAPAPDTAPHGYTITKPVRGSRIPADYSFVLTRDEIYVPIAVRKPKGAGPFPAITMASGNGRGAMPHVEQFVDDLALMQDAGIVRNRSKIEGAIQIAQKAGVRVLAAVTEEKQKQKPGLFGR